MMMDPQIEKARSYIDQNYTRELSVRTLADIACLSEFHFSRLFSAQVGEGVSAYIRRKRVEYARELLRETDRTIIAVATEAGFAILSNFNKAFLKLTGVAPNRYRLEARKKEEESSIKDEEQSSLLSHNYPVSNFIRRIIEMNLTEATLDDMDVADDAKTSDVCVVLPAGFGRPDDGVLYKIVRGGLFLKYEYYDTNERFGLVYKDVVTDYLPTSVYGLDTDRNFLEFVMNDPFTDPEGKVRIDLYIPVGRRA